MNTNTLGIILKQLQCHEMIDFLEALESNKKLKDITVPFYWWFYKWFCRWLSKKYEGKK